jgi:sugar phosphate isomerase/epimerase
VLVFAETSNAIHGDRSKPLSQRPVMKDGDWAEWGRRVTQVAEHTLSQGVRLVYHHHMGTIVESQADIDAYMRSTGPAAHLLLDTATPPGAAPIRRLWRGATGTASATCTPRTCARP